MVEDFKGLGGGGGGGELGVRYYFEDIAIIIKIMTLCMLWSKGGALIYKFLW